MSALAGVRALLVDLEGTVFQDRRLIPGAATALAQAASRGLAVAFVTNTTSRPRSVLVRELAEMGLPVDVEAVFSAPRAARAYLSRTRRTRCFLLARLSLLEDLPGIEVSESEAEAVLLGDLGQEMRFDRLNRAFRLLVGGAELVALARNRYWRAEDGLVLDVGAFAAALEYASGKPATLVGKPSPEFFGAVLAALGVAAAETVVIGDDLESDVGGAQGFGMRGVLVRTGKFQPGDLERSRVAPDAVLDSLADLPRLL
jgi:phospholysine phosphohistidine inorganic pyrophosphate phosphatase